MDKQLAILYFSPTNTTKTICTEVALGMGTKNPIMLNMTLPISNQNPYMTNYYNFNQFL